MEYQSILFENNADRIANEACRMPEYLKDLNLDQIIREILEGKEEYELDRFFYQNLRDVSSINYRLDIMKEMEKDEVYECIVAFASKMKRIKEYVGFSRETHNQYQRKKWLLDSANLYCDTINNLCGSLRSIDLKSEGLCSFREWLTEYTKSSLFGRLYDDTKRLSGRFSNIRYSVEIDSGKVIVKTDDYTEDYCASISETLEHINETVFDCNIRFFSDLEMCPLESKVLEIVRNMNIDVFNELDKYYEMHIEFIDNAIKCFDREIQFYVSYWEYIKKLKLKGFRFAYPSLSNIKTVNVTGGYDLALAYKCSGSAAAVVPNDFSLRDEERVFLLTGPNQGGKTTFARAFGQIFFLASIGCPVPCEKAELFPVDNIFTHFAAEENLDNNAGRLKEELIRLKKIMRNVSASSVVIINELFASTTSHDAYTMGKKILEYFIMADCICLYVTHIHELASASEGIISLVATVNQDMKTTRTYKIVRKPADGCAYANSIAEKYNLAYSQIKERIGT
jgi:DNA mismatch repair protein MutS